MNTKKLLALALSAALAAVPFAAYAEEDGSNVDKGDKPPVTVDEKFDVDIQDFLTDETVGQVKVILPENEDTEIIFNSGKPYLDKDQRMRVSLRDVAEQLGYTVHWYEETGQIIVSNDDDWYTFTPNDNIVVCSPQFVGTDTDGNKIDAGHMVMDCSPCIIDGVTYIPLRHIANILRYNVIWDTDSFTAKLYNLSVVSYGSGVVYYDIDESDLS